jgi:hypothetical protein
VYQNSPQGGSGNNMNYSNYNNSAPMGFDDEEEDYENEPPLLEELGMLCMSLLYCVWKPVIKLRTSI